MGNYSKADIRLIVEKLIDELRECEDGMSITTAGLLAEAGYDTGKYDMDELADIHFYLLKAAKENHITLDMSAHEGKLEGLPYNLDYIVNNQKAQIKCPHCGSMNTARILYGMPAFDEKLAKKLDEGKISLGGCCVEAVDVNGNQVMIMPDRYCNECGKEFGRPPLIIAKDYSSAEDYRDIVRSVRFSIGGFLLGYTDIKITGNDKGATVKTQSFVPGKMPVAEKQISANKWNRILNELYSRMYLHEWKKRYENLCVLDGEDWELEIKLTGNRVRHYRGSNEYPPYWPELKKLFRAYRPTKYREERVR